MHKRGLLLASLLLALALGGRTLAASTPGFSISRWVIGNGGGTSSSSSYTLNATVGQTAAGPPLTGGSFTLTSGYWGGASAARDARTFLPLVQR